MSAASLAFYLIGKLKSDEAAIGDMSGRGRGSPTPRLTAVWRTKSIPYDIPDTSNSFRNEGSLLRLLRTKSMPLLGREGSTPPRRPAFSPQGRSPPRSESPSPVRNPTSRILNSRNMSSGHLSDASESTVPSVSTPPPTPRSPSPSGPRRRSASDGHLWQRRKKQMRRATDKAAIKLPSVKNLRGKFDEKFASLPGDEHPPAGPGEADSDALLEDSETDEGREGRRVSRHYSLVRHEVKSPERRQPQKPAVTPANVRKLLEKFEISPQDEHEDSEVFPGTDPQELRSKCRSEVTLETTTSEARQKDQTRRRTCPVGRQRTKNHRRSKSEPDPSAVLRHYAQASPPSVKKLKIMFERESLDVSGRDFTRETSEERTIPLERQKETTPEPPQTRVLRGKAAEETAAVDSSAADTLRLGVVEATKPRQQARITPKVDHVLAAGTPSVRSLRQRFEAGASSQSLVKTADEEVAPRPRRAIVHHLKTPFEKSERQKSRSVSPEKESRQSLTSFSSASVKNLMRQFEEVSPEETQREVQGDLGHDPRSPRSPPPTDSQKRLQTSPLVHATGEAQQDAESVNKFTLEVEVDSMRRLRRQSQISSSESSSGDEWREEEGIRRRKVIEQERTRKEEEERQRIEQEEKMLREKIEMEKIAKEEKERITKEKEKEKREKERIEQERKVKENDEKERRAKEILEKEREAKKKLEVERKIRERVEQERLAKEEEEKRKEREILQQKQQEKEKAEMEREEKEREKEKKEREEEERKERERAKYEKEIQDKAEEERREREKVEKEKAQEEEKRKKREREEAERLLNKQLEEERRKEEERKSREEFRRRLSDEEMPKGVGLEERHENHDDKPSDKPSDRKVHEMIGRFTHLGQPGDDLPPDASCSPQGKASSEQQVERLIDQFTNLRDADLEGEARKGDEDGEGRRCSDVAALVNKFRKLNERRKSSSSSESESESGRSREKPVKEAPIPTIPARSSGPGKVRTLREDEIRFFESSASGAADSFMRTQSLRIKKTQQSNFTQPRFGSLRGSKTRVAVLSTSSTTNAALPQNCRHLNSDELRFFTGEVTNIYRSRTANPRGRAGKTGGGDGRPPKVPRDNALPNTEEFFRIAGRGDQEGEPNGRPAPSQDDSDSEPSVLRGGDDLISDSDGDIYEMDINLRSDADTEDLSDTEHQCDLDHPLSLLVHSIKGELLQPMTSEGCKEAESRCYVVFSPENYLCSSEDEDEALQFPFASHTLKENVPAPALKENGISSTVQVQEGTLHDAPGEAMILNAPTGKSEVGQSTLEHTEGENHTFQPVVLTYSREKDASSSQIMDSSQHGSLTTTENGSIIDFLGETKVDSQPLEGLKGFVLTDRETGETEKTDSREGDRPLLTREKRDCSDDDEKEEEEEEQEKVKNEEEEVNIKKVNLLEKCSEEHGPDDAQLLEEQQAIAAFLEELDKLNSLPPSARPRSPPTRREDPYQIMNDDDSSSYTSSEDSQGHTGLSTEDMRSIEEQIIPHASFQGILACPERPSSTPRGDDGSPGTAKELRDIETPLQDPITPLRTTEDLFIAAPPSGTQEPVLTNSFSAALKKEKEEEVEEKEDHTFLPSQHIERQEKEEKTEIREDANVLKEEAGQTPPPQEEEDPDIITGREFIKFCIFSLWFSLVMYFFSDVIQ